LGWPGRPKPGWQTHPYLLDLYANVAMMSLLRFAWRLHSNPQAAKNKIREDALKLLL
jgi:hypothetical protein